MKKFINILKSHVKGHIRKTKSGKIFRVKDYSTKKLKNQDKLLAKVSINIKKDDIIQSLKNAFESQKEILYELNFDDKPNYITSGKIEKITNHGITLKGISYSFGELFSKNKGITKILKIDNEEIFRIEGEKKQEKNELIEWDKYKNLKIDEIVDRGLNDHNANILIQNKADLEDSKVILYQLDILKKIGILKPPQKVTIRFEHISKGEKLHGNFKYGGSANAAYSPNTKTILIASRYKTSFIHEFFHHLDYSIKSNIKHELTKIMWESKSYREVFEKDPYMKDIREMRARLAEGIIYDLLKDYKNKKRIVDISTGRYNFTQSERKKMFSIFKTIFFI